MSRLTRMSRMGINSFGRNCWSLQASRFRRALVSPHTQALMGLNRGFANGNSNDGYLNDASIIRLAKNGERDRLEQLLKDIPYKMDGTTSIREADRLIDSNKPAPATEQDIYAIYDASLMGSFFELWISDKAASESSVVTPIMTRDEFVNLACDDPDIKVLIKDIKCRKDYVSSFYGQMVVFGENFIKSQTLSKLHVGAPGIGKTVCSKAALKCLSIAFPGLATAFVELQRLPKAFGRPPMPREIFEMAQKASNEAVSKLFVFYDDFEVCYDKHYGPDLTSAVYIEADDNLDILVHLLGSSQWLSELVHRRLPVMSMMPQILATDNSKRFKYYGECTSINEGRMREYGMYCEPVMNRDEFASLFAHICEERGIKVNLNDKVLNGIQWFVSGNARICDEIITELKAHNTDAFARRLVTELDSSYYGLTEEGSKMFDKILEKLMEINVRGQYLAPYGLESGGLEQYVADRDPFALVSVPRSELHFNDAGDNQVGIIKRLIETGLLSQDSNDNVFPGRLIYLPMHAIGDTKATRDETKKQLTAATIWLGKTLAEALVGKFGGN